MAENNKLAVKPDVGQQVINRVEELAQVGFSMPRDYQYVNAIKASMLKLQEVKDKNGKPALEVCTKESIQSAFFEMVTKGLDASRSQAYLLVRGDKLCMHESYFGKILRVKRIFPDFNPTPRLIHEGDEFVYETDAVTGRKKLIKHTQDIENLDKDFVGGYMYIPTSDGGQDLFVMTKKMIITAWSKSSSKELGTHKAFPIKMANKTIISSACTTIINSTPDIATEYDEKEDNNEIENNPQIKEQREFIEAEVIEETTVEEAPKERKPRAKKSEAPAEEKVVEKPKEETPADKNDDLPFVDDNDKF